MLMSHRFSSLIGFFLTATLIMWSLSAKAGETHVHKSGVVNLSHNDWDWVLLDENGHPVQDAMVLEPYFSEGGYSYREEDVRAIATRFRIADDNNAPCQYLQDWLTRNPEAVEHPQILNMFETILPFRLEWKAWSGKAGTVREVRWPINQLRGRFRIFFKPGYYPLAVYFSYTPPLDSVQDNRVYLHLRTWPERMSALPSRPWVQDNWALQHEISLAKDQLRQASGGTSSRIIGTGLFGYDPLPKWEKRLDRLRVLALKSEANRDAAWLSLATAGAARRVDDWADTTGDTENLQDGRIYQGLDQAIQLYPESDILQARQALRRFSLQLPTLAMNGGGPAFLKPARYRDFPMYVPWNKAVLTEYERVIAPFAKDPLTLLRLTSPLATVGLLERSPPDIVKAAFQLRSALKQRSYEQYPSAAWLRLGIDAWDYVQEAQSDERTNPDGPD